MAAVFHMADNIAGPRIDVIPAVHHGKVNAHSHRYYEIVYVVDGFTLHAAGGMINLLVAGDLFFVKPGEEHSYINAYQTRIFNLTFEAAELGSLFGELSALPGLDDMFAEQAESGEAAASAIGIRLLHIPISERRAAESALREMVDEREQKRPGWESALRVSLASFLIRYARLYAVQWDSHPASADDYYGYIYKILCYIDSHYGGIITMSDLSSVTGLSPDYMTRKFKSALHMTPSEYVRKFRIARAMELLCTTSLPVSEIASRTGFSDVSLFSRVFKQSVGLPPAAYRKNIME